MSDLFVYGSLMFEPVWDRVAQSGKQSSPARLAGFARLAVRGETYPAIVRRPGASVDGRLVRSVSAAELERLDAFEGPDYERIAVQVECDGRQVAADAYLCIRPELLDDRPWDFDWFAREGIGEFIARYGGFAR